METRSPAALEIGQWLAEAAAASRHGAHREGAALARRALQAAEANADAAGASAARAALASHLVRLGEIEAALANGQLALARLQRSGPAALQRSVLTTLSLAYERAGLLTLATTHAAQALDIARASGDPLGECEALIRLGCTARGADDAPRGFQMLERAVALAASLPQAEDLHFTALNNLARRMTVEADRLREAGQTPRATLEGAQVHAQAALALAEAGAHPLWKVNAWSNLAGIDRRLGQAEQARNRFAAALDLAQHEGYGGLAATVRLALACLDFETSPDSRTRGALESALAAPAEGTDPDLLRQSHAALVSGYRAMGDFEAALDHLERLHANALAEQAVRADLQARLLTSRAELEQTQHEAERAQLEAELQGLRAETAQLAKRRFLSSASHELRTPVNGLLGMVDAARRRATDARQIEQLTLASRAGRELADLLSLLLDYVAAEDPRLAERAPTDLRALIASLGEAARPVARERDLGLVVDVSDQLPPWLLLDERRLHRVLETLLGNALKFATAGPLVMAADWDAATAAGPRLRLEVADAGPGIAPEVQAQLFEIFETGDASSTRPHGGLGVGLALVRRLVQAMGGEVGLVSQPGHGSSFRVSLPAPAAEPGSLGPHPHR